MKDKYAIIPELLPEEVRCQTPEDSKDQLITYMLQDHTAQKFKNIWKESEEHKFFDKFSIQERNFVEAQFLSLLGRTRVSLAKTSTVDVVVETWKVTRSTRLASVSIVAMSQPKNFFRVVRGTVQLIAPDHQPCSICEEMLPCPEHDPVIPVFATFKAKLGIFSRIPSDDSETPDETTGETSFPRSRSAELIDLAFSPAFLNGKCEEERSGGERERERRENERKSEIDRKTEEERIEEGWISKKEI
jgi:hypothetical protein